MSSHAAVAAAFAGAWFAPSIPWWTAVMAVVAAFVLRRRGPRILVMAVAVAVVAAAAATGARSSMDFPAAGPFDGWVTLVDDPRASGSVGVRVTVRAGDRRLTATAYGPVAGRLDDALAGDRLRLTGTIRPVSRSDRRLLLRHVVGRITVDGVVDRLPAAPVNAFANSIRTVLDDGAASLDRSDRALFLGMVIGDDRGQTPVTADDFRAAGLGHLLVVSGQNVAFVLAVAMPVAGRLRPAGRALVLFVVLAVFAVLTRFEPSVLRATAMAGIGIGASALGRPVDGRVGLSWAVAGLLIIDPFLARVAAFQLSAAATGGIVWLGGPLAVRLPGPQWFAIPVATTVAAQLAVSPVLISIFGPIPLASLPANVLAGPAGGAVMIWGCTAGLAAGVFGGAVAGVIHLPTRLLLWWVGGIASTAAAAPAATIAAGSAATLVGLVTISVVRRRHEPVLAAIAAAVCLFALVRAPAPRDGCAVIGDGVTSCHSAAATVLVLDDPPRPRDVLQRVREAGVRRPVLVVALDGDRADAEAVLALRDRFGPLPVAAPPLHRVPGGRTVTSGQIIETTGPRLRVDGVEPRLSISFLAAEA